MPKHLFSNALILVSLFISCTGVKTLEKQSFMPPASLEYGESQSITEYGLSVEFKKMEVDSFALFFQIINDRMQLDSLPVNFNEEILVRSLKKQATDAGFRLILTKNYTMLSIRSENSLFEPIFHQMVEVIYNQSFDSTLVSGNIINPEALQRYHSDKFVTSRMAFAIIGDFELTQIENLITKYFNGRTVGKYSQNDFTFPLDGIIINHIENDTTDSDSLKSGE